MGFSKKKEIRKAKQAKHMSPKAKERAKKSRVIEQRQQLKESKRKGAQAAGRNAKGSPDDLLSQMNAVDALFASWEAEDKKAKRRGRQDDSDDDDSSAGAFHDDAGSETGHEGDFSEDEGEEDAEARHMRDLQLIKERDPKFYEFLLKQDKALLNFRAPTVTPGVADDDDEEGASADEEQKEQQVDDEEDKDEDEGRSQALVITLERFQRISDAAKTSYSALKASVSAFHSAVRSVEMTGRSKKEMRAKDDSAASFAPDDTATMSRSQSRRRRAGLMRVEDEAVFSEIVEWSVANLLSLLLQHAGELPKRKVWKKSTKKGGEEAAPSGPIDVAQLEKWRRVRVMAVIFWEEVLTLVNNLKAQPLLEHVLRHVSTPEALSWLWPFKKVRYMMFKRCSTLWSTNSTSSVRLLAFLFLRNGASMSMHLKEVLPNGKPALEEHLRNAVKVFAAAADRGYSWRSLNTFRFMENCLLEMFQLEDATSYRVGYVCIRQLALVLRNACLATSTIGTAAVKKSGKKQDPNTGKVKRRKQVTKEQQVHALYSWTFVRTVYMWTKAVSHVKCLRPLAYPLSMVVFGAVKSKLNSLTYFPFVYHLLHNMNMLASTLEVFVPISSHLLKVFSLAVQAMERARKSAQKHQGEKSVLSKVKAPELEVLLHFPVSQASEPIILEAVGGGLCQLFTDHLGLLSRSPAFPEVVAPVLLHLRRYKKHCPSESLRRQVQNLVQAVETSSDTVRARRESLRDVPDWKKFLIFEADTAIGKARASMLQRLDVEERRRVEAAQEKKDPADERKRRRMLDGIDELDMQDGEGLSKQALKRRRQKEKKLAALKEAEEEGAAATQARKKARVTVGKALSHPKAVDRDVVEEMDFEAPEDD